MTWREGFTPERRLQTRRISSDPLIVVSIRPGQAVTMIDRSSAGVLVESARPLRPGANVELQIIAGDQRTLTRGQVVRCSISQLQTNRVWYRGAIHFDRPLLWLAAELEQGYCLPVSEGASAVARADVARLANLLQV